MIHSLFGNQDQNKDINIKNPQSNIRNMKKGVMVNGSEVYYGKGTKIDTSKYNKSKIGGKNYNISKSYKTKTVTYTNQIRHNKQITYVGKEDKIIEKNMDYPKSIIEDNDIGNLIDSSQPHCTISIRLYKGDLVEALFNNNQKLRDIYNFVKKVSRNNCFDLLEGFPPKPLVDYDKTIEELGLVNSVLTQRVG